MKKNRKKYKLLVFILAIFAISLSFTSINASHNINTAYDWNFKPNKTHTKPVVIPEAKTFIDNYPNILYYSKTEEKTIYLTFDAGFDNGYHNVILNILKEENVYATFFVDGNFVKRNPELVLRIVNEGHIIGNHTLNHPDMTKYKDDFESYSKQLLDWEALVKNITGNDVIKLMRFPMGRFSEQNIIYNQQLGYKSVFWSFAYYDFDVNKQPTHEKAKSLIYERIHPGAIILLHSTSKTNSEILKDVIRDLKAQGYNFGKLTNII